MKGKKRLLITGASGLLGGITARIAADDFEVFATYNSNANQISGCRSLPLDIRNQQQVASLFEEIKPAMVIHSAALVNVDYCEAHAGEARATNVKGAENVVLAAKRVGAKMVYISTDSVFDGEKGMYVEEDTTHPLNVYARTKLEGESRVQQRLPDSTIIRTAFYGWSPGSSSKVSLADWVIRSLRQGKTIKMFTDIFFSPIFTGNLAAVIIAMCRQDISGIYHVAGSERCSKYSFGQELADVFGLDKELIKPGSIAEAGLRAPRAKDLSLGIAKVSGIIDARLLDARGGIVSFKDAESSGRGR